MIPVKKHMDIMTLAINVLPEEFGLTGKPDKTKKK